VLDSVFGPTAREDNVCVCKPGYVNSERNVYSYRVRRPKIKTNRRIALSGERVGRVVDAGELDADGNVEVGLDRREGHRVEHHTLQVTRKFRGAGKVDELQRVNGFGV